MSNTKKAKPSTAHPDFEAAAAEAAGDSDGDGDGVTVIHWNGLELTAGPPHEWLFAFQIAEEKFNFPGMVRAIFGQKGLDAVVATGATSLDQIADLLTAIRQEADGQGNGSRPSGS